MLDPKMTAILVLSTLSAPIALPASPLLAPNAPIALPASPLLAPNAPEVEVSASSARTSLRRAKHQLAMTPILQPIGTYVGELQEKWQFPSDHLPIGMTFEDHHIASW